MNYLALKEPITVWIPIYEVHLTFRITKLGDTLDALPYIILTMLNDHKSIQDILLVTHLSSEIIQSETSRLISVGVLDNDLAVAPPGQRILAIYATADTLSEQKQNFYVDCLTRKLHLQQQKDMTINALPAVPQTATVKNDGILPGQSKILFSNTHQAVQELLNQNGIKLTSDEFYYDTYIGKRKFLKRRITHLPVFTPGTASEDVLPSSTLIACEIPYNLYVVPTDSQKYVFYIHPITQKVAMQKLENQSFPPQNGILVFANPPKGNELDIIKKAIKDSNIPVLKDIDEKKILRYATLLHQFADANQLFKGDAYET